MTADNLKAIMLGAGALVAGVVAWRLVSSARSIGQGVANAWPSVNPASPDNLIYRGAGAVVREVTGGAVDSVGQGIYEGVEAIKRALGIPTAGQVATQPTPFDRPRASSWTAADQDDADLGAAMRSNSLGLPFYTVADNDDAELGRAMTAGAGAPFLDYSHLTRRYKR